MVDVWTGWVGGERLAAGAGERLLVRSPYDGGHVAEVAWTAPEQVETAVAAAHAGRREVGAAPAHVRAAALAHVSARARGTVRGDRAAGGGRVGQAERLGPGRGRPR